MGNAAEQPLSSPAHEDRVVGLRELEESGLENGDVVARLRIEALEERRLRLVEMRQLLLDQAIAAYRVLQQLLVDVVVAEALRRAHADFGSTRSHLM